MCCQVKEATIQPFMLRSESRQSRHKSYELVNEQSYSNWIPTKFNHLGCEIEIKINEEPNGVFHHNLIIRMISLNDLIK